MSNIRWVVQNNLTKPELMVGLKDACAKYGVEHFEATVIPFSDELPEFPKDLPIIFYGSTTMMNNVYRDPELNKGLFYNHETFSMELYFEKWGKHMLNFDGKITCFEELMKEPYGPDDLIFVRPNDDSKSFAGEIVQFSRIGEWYKNLTGFENVNLTPQTKIVVCEPYNIKKEWRLWIVNKQVVASSLYMENKQLKKVYGTTGEVLDFAEARCKEFVPHDIFVMDICQCGDELYILECGCMNSAGFYAADIDMIVMEVSERFKRGLLHEA